MFTLPNFCRVCLKYDKNLIDLAHIENEPSETLMSKLQLCVSEVEWTTFKPLLCHPCIKRLNIAYSFKKQCVQSAGVLKNYVELVRESQKKNESQSTVKTENPMSQGGAYMLLPNQKYVKILVGSQNQGTTGNPPNTFQNVFLNLIPTTTISPVPSTPDISAQKNKDTNQNVFLNINNTFQKFIPITSVDPPPLKKHEPPKRPKESLLKTNLNVTELLTESKAEEMSVEIDPTSLLSLEHDDPVSSENESANDWDEVITKQTIDPKQSRINGTGANALNGRESIHPPVPPANFVPILPKDDLYSGGHFLSSSPGSDINCEACQRSFSTLRLLKQHLKQFHMGKLPFKCNYCYTEYLTRTDYETCLIRHKKEQESPNTPLTLKDFTGNYPSENDALSISIITETPADQNLEPNENGEYVCELCKGIFNSSAGLLRHRVRKHHQKNTKKYFIKGMKNARCDICKREFSTQSYMQLHKKLHLRDDGGSKFKVPGRSKYKDLLDEEAGEKDKSKEHNDKESKDDSSERIKEESDTDSDNEDQKVKKRKVDDGGSSDSQEAKGQDHKLDGNSMGSNDIEIKKEQEEGNSMRSNDVEIRKEQEEGNSMSSNDVDIKMEQEEEESESSEDSDSDSSSEEDGNDKN